MYSLITDRITISRKSPVMVSHLIFITRFSTTSPTTLGEAGSASRLFSSSAYSGSSDKAVYAKAPAALTSTGAFSRHRHYSNLFTENVVHGSGVPCFVFCARDHLNHGELFLAGSQQGSLQNIFAVHFICGFDVVNFQPFDIFHLFAGHSVAW